jgi:hypothetical protein
VRTATAGADGQLSLDVALPDGPLPSTVTVGVQPA